MTAVEAGFLPSPASDETPAPDLEDLLGDLIDPGYSPGDQYTERYPLPATTPIQKKLRSTPDRALLAAGATVTEQEYSRHSKRIVDKFNAMRRNGGEIPEEYRTKKFAQRLLPREWGEEGPTITATSLPDDYVHFAQPRILTVREWARLQMFPDWYRFAGKRTTGGTRRAGNPREEKFDREVPKYTQIGNAVPVELARRVGEHFRSMLKKG
jgi:DNA (cytosine-5)-methyltransferase 1